MEVDGPAEAGGTETWDAACSDIVGGGAHDIIDSSLSQRIESVAPAACPLVTVGTSVARFVRAIWAGGKVVMLSKSMWAVEEDGKAVGSSYWPVQGDVEVKPDRADKQGVVMEDGG